MQTMRPPGCVSLWHLLLTSSWAARSGSLNLTAWWWPLSAEGAWTALWHTGGHIKINPVLITNTFLRRAARYRSCCRSSGCFRSGTAAWPERCTHLPPSPASPWASSGHICPGSTLLQGRQQITTNQNQEIFHTSWVELLIRHLIQRWKFVRYNSHLGWRIKIKGTLNLSVFLNLGNKICTTECHYFFGLSHILPLERPAIWKLHLATLKLFCD